jgi:PAS domain S-box-containing protein
MSSSSAVFSDPNPPFVWGAAPLDDHLVQFYDNEDFLSDVAVTFLGTGMAAGEPAVVIATGAHRRAFAERLTSTGFDVTEACRSGQLTLLDARATLASVMVAGAPDRQRFRDVVGSLIEQRVHDSAPAPVRAYGEMVDILWRDGHPKAAIALEEMWNELQRQLPFKLLCAYVMGDFCKDADGLHEICKAHGSVLALGPEGMISTDAIHAPAHPFNGDHVRRQHAERAFRDSFRELRRAEQELRDRQRELQDFVENAPVGLHRIDADGRILWANRAELELLGYGAPEYFGRNIADFHADPRVAQRLLAHLAKGETVRDFEATLRTRDGSLRHVNISSNVHRREGRFLHARSFTRDVTQRKRDEDSRRLATNRTERLTLITAAIADAVTAEQVFEAVVDQVALAANASSAALWMVDQEEAAVKLVHAVGYDDDARQKLSATGLDTPYGFPALDAIRRGEPIWIASQQELLRQYGHLASFVSPDRSYCIAALPVVIQSRHLGSLSFTFDDAPPIDDEERSFLMLVARYAGQALERLRLVEENQHARARAELLYKLVGSVVDASSFDDVFAAGLDAIGSALQATRSSILAFDPQGVMRFCAWRGLSDAYRQAVEGHSPWAKDARAPEPIFVTNVETDPGVRAYLPLFRAERIGALGFIPLVAAGRLIGKFMVYYDRPRQISAHELELARAIADHVAAGIARFSAVQELEKTVRFNEMFTAILGHDLRNPLGAILATADMAIRRGENVSAAKPLTRIMSAGRRMARMIDQLLDFTRARLGTGIPLDRKQLDMVPLVRQVLEELAVAHPSWGFRLQHAGDTNGGWDDDRLSQVFSNLLGNAVEHGIREHGIEVHIDGTSPEAIRIHVHNMGFVPDELASRVFDPMTGGERRREKSNGLGLGLFITQQIARAHGGRVEVASSEAGGTTFTVLLPRRALQAP